MKKCKRLAAFLLTVCLLLELSGAALAAGSPSGLERFTNRNTYTTGIFTDIAANSWYYENVKSVYELDLMVGDGTRFNPNGNITIAEVVSIAARLHAIYYGSTIPTGGAGAWYQPYADYALKNGILTSAYSSYSSAATRLQFVTILSKALPDEALKPINQVADNAIPDMSASAPDASGVYLFYRAGILVGNDDKGTFAPASTIRRSEVAAIVTRMVKPDLRASVTLGSVPQASVSGSISVSGNEICSKPLEEAHVKTGTMTYMGETGETLYIDNELILMGSASASKADIQSIAAGYGGTIVGQIPLAKAYQIELSSAKTIAELEALADTLAKNSKISAAFVNTVNEYDFQAGATNDTYKTIEKALTENPWTDERTWHLRASHVPEAWALVKKVNQSPSITLGIIDDSVDDDNADLKLREISYAKGDAQSEWSARNFPKGAEHGTHVAGIMAAIVNNKRGVAGVALNADLYAVACRKNMKDKNCMDSCYEEFASVYWLLEQGCKIINISVGSGGGLNPIIKHRAHMNELMMSPILDIVEDHPEHDFLIVTSAGNSGEKSHNVNYNNAWTKVEDARLKSRILVVGNAGSLESGGYQRAADSSYVGGRVDVMAPGTKIFSLSPYGDPRDECVRGSGTSMASPFAAGVAALVWEANPRLSGAEVKRIVTETATIPVQDSYCGMVDAEAAVRLALEKAGYDVEALENADRVKNVSFRFRDAVTQTTLQSGSVTQKGISYDGYADVDLSDWNYTYVNMGGNTVNGYPFPLPYGQVSLRFSASGYQDKTVSFTVDDDTDTVVVDMIPNADKHKIFCTVKDLEDSPIENAVVTLTVDRRTVKAATDSNGICSFDTSLYASIISPQWSFSVEDTNAYTYFTGDNPSASGTGSFSSFDGTLYVRTGQDKGETLCVIVLDENDTPVAGAVVTYDSSSQSTSATSGEDGWAILTGLNPNDAYWKMGVQQTDEYSFDIDKTTNWYGFDASDPYPGVLYVQRTAKWSIPEDTVKLFPGHVPGHVLPSNPD